MLKKVVMTIFLSTLCLANSLLAGETVVLTTLDWEPYIGEKLPSQGFVAEIVKEAFKRSGYEVKYQFYPWARSVKMSDDAVVDGYFPEYYAKEREDFAIFSEPFDGGPVGFFKRKIDKISYSKLEDLKAYKIGVVRGYVNEEKFDAAGYLKKEEVADDITNIKKLLAGRLDLFVCDKFVGLYTAKVSMPDKVNELEFIDPPLVKQNLYVCISKKTKNSMAKMKAFNDGLAQMKKDGTYKKILTKYGFGSM